jgi:hypothetical protein
MEQFVKSESELMGVISGQLIVHRDSAQRRRFGRHEDKEFGVNVLEKLFDLLSFKLGRITANECIDVCGENRGCFDGRRKNDFDINSGG